VRKAAEMFLSKESRLDVLMNNAGVMMTPTKDLTKDGYDLQFGVNVLAHFHLTSLLLPALLAVPSPRIINLSSEMHRRGPKNGIEWDTLKGPKKRSWFPVLDTMASIKLYSQSKLVCLGPCGRYIYSPLPLWNDRGIYYMRTKSRGDTVIEV
ncbi:hypothetical protein FRC16_006957, partial [Serendipita sp. 398]